jgi:hypothetical protein
MVTAAHLGLRLPGYTRYWFDTETAERLKTAGGNGKSAAAANVPGPPGRLDSNPTLPRAAGGPERRQWHAGRFRFLTSSEPPFVRGVCHDVAWQLRVRGCVGAWVRGCVEAQEHVM